MSARSLVSVIGALVAAVAAYHSCYRWDDDARSLAAAPEEELELPDGRVHRCGGPWTVNAGKAFAIAMVPETAEQDAVEQPMSDSGSMYPDKSSDKGVAAEYCVLSMVEKCGAFSLEWPISWVKRVAFELNNGKAAAELVQVGVVWEK